MKTDYRTACLLSLCLAVALPAAADKLDDYGLTRDGKPKIAALPAKAERSYAPDELKDEAARLAAEIVGGKGVKSTETEAGAFPPGSRLTEVRIDEKGFARFLVDFPEDFITSPALVQAASDRVNGSIIGGLQHLPIVGFEVHARDPRSGEYRQFEEYLPPPPSQDSTPEPDLASPPRTAAPDAETSAAPKNQYPRGGSGRPTGALSGKTVYLNPGHGYVWRDWDAWGLQRTFVHNNMEDFSNVDTVNQWLTAYLYNAGADVFSVREMDFNSNMVIVDNDDGNNGTKGYFETGSWSTSTLAGFENGHIPYTNGQNPFSYGTSRLATCVTGTPTATASWVPEIPESGWYNVYVSHGAFTNRPPQAHYRIYHAGGETDYYIDQRQRRFTWIPIGNYYFEAGVNPSSAKVVLLNDSSSASHYVSADAVRFGGGRGVISRGMTAGASGYPRTDEDARYNSQFAGAPTSVYDPGSGNNDEEDGWSGRPLFARWLKQQAEAHGAPAQDSVFVSSHTNAGGGTGLGTFVNTNNADTWHDTFRDYIHDEVLNDLSNGYSTNYKNHGTGKKYGNYGENNPGNVSNTMPIMLGEWLFHDSAADMALYHDPKFRMMKARAIYQGIVKFWANRNGTAVNLLPEPPRNLRVKQLSATSVQLSWDAPLTDAQGIVGGAATGYKVYRGTHGRGFPPATAVSGGATLTYTVNGLTPGTTYYFYVTATNAGGESFPTETMAARPQPAGTPKLLLVNGFDKLDFVTAQEMPWTGGTIRRQKMMKMNTRDYVVEHAKAISAWSTPVGFDSCEDESVELSQVNLADYAAVIWIGGIQAEVSTTDPTNDISISATQQTRLSTYLGAGGRLFISGAEIAWDLDRAGTTTFVDNSLKANYVADSAGTSGITPAAGGIFAGMTPLNFDDGNGPTYRVKTPDVIAPVGGSSAALTYGGGSTSLEPFESLGNWKDPNYSGSTNADAASTFDIVSAQVRQGSTSGRLNYVWGASGNFIREHNTAGPSLPSGAVLSVWVYGDNSGHQFRISLRDGDGDLWVNNYTVINWSGWRQVTWNLATDPKTKWAGSGDGAFTGPNVTVESIQLQKVTAVASGSIYFDDMTYVSTGGGSSVAAIQYSGPYRLVYLAFPFETITTEAARNELMARSLEFLIGTSGITEWNDYER